MIARLWRTHRVLLLAFVVGLCALGYFGVRTISSAIYWMDPAHQEQALAGWVTPRYVGQSYNLPRDRVLDALMLDPHDPPRRVSLSEIADLNEMTLQDLQDLQTRVDAAMAQMAAEREAQRGD